MTLSVLLPVYNSEHTIKSAIISVLLDLEAEDELVICNDASTDSTLDRINEVKDDRIVLFNNYSNLGISDSLNNTLRVSKGNVISRMDSDDLWIKGRRKFIKEFYSLPQNSDTVLFGSYNIFNNSTKIILSHFECPPQKINIVSLIIRGDFLHPTMSVLKKNMLNYDSELCGIEDMYLYFKLIKKGMSFYKTEVQFLDYFRDKRNYNKSKRYKLQLNFLKKTFSWNTWYQTVLLFIIFSGAYLLKLMGLYKMDKKFS
jgi:glycosyltransferase involved in cell wall biosynthesis